MKLGSTSSISSMKKVELKIEHQDCRRKDNKVEKKSNFKAR